MTQSPRTHPHLQEYPLSMVVNEITQCAAGVPEWGFPEGWSHPAMSDNLFQDTKVNSEVGQLTCGSACTDNSTSLLA